FINVVEQAYQLTIEQLMNKTLDVETLPKDLLISKVLIDEEKEKPKLDKTHTKAPAAKEVRGAAFHEKKEKNKKVNLGGPGRREKLKGRDAKIRTRRHDS
ncbi:MAG: ATP-dependent helicase, partial [Bacteroidetes bacterium]|nr:ATP-dependent helicase [Bacteroidota bacterium]